MFIPIAGCEIYLHNRFLQLHSNRSPNGCAIVELLGGMISQKIAVQ